MVVVEEVVNVTNPIAVGAILFKEALFDDV